MSRYRALRGIPTPALGVVATQKDALAEATHDELVEVVQRAQLLAIQLEISRTSHRRIGIATGIVMGLQRLPEKDAFELLRRASMNLNEKLVEVAEHSSTPASCPPPAATRPGSRRKHTVKSWTSQTPQTRAPRRRKNPTGAPGSNLAPTAWTASNAAHA